LLRRIEYEKKGLNPEEKSISSNLTMVLTAFNDNECAKQTDLKIETITVTTNSVIIFGDTSGREKTLKFINVLEKNGLKESKLNDTIKDGRCNFNVTVVPMK
jgi:hypothetical protein